MAMSATALTACLLAATGVARDPAGDEGAMAHIFQLCIAIQVPVICLFARVTVRQGSRRDRTVLGAQLVLLVAALAAVPVLGL